MYRTKQAMYYLIDSGSLIREGLHYLQFKSDILDVRYVPMTWNFKLPFSLILVGPPI